MVLYLTYMFVVIIFGNLLLVAPLILIWQICSSSSQYIKVVARLNFNFGGNLIWQFIKKLPIRQN